MILLDVIGPRFHDDLRELAETKLQRFESGKLTFLVEPFGTTFDDHYNDPRFLGLVRSQLDALLP